MKNILVTGGAGYIGSHIVEDLIKKKYNVVIVDNLKTGYKKLINKKAKFYKNDILNKKIIRKIILKNEIDTIIHLAASINITDSKKDNKLFYKNNVKGTSNLIESCKNTLIKNFIFSSSAAIYHSSNKKVKENSLIKPKSIYGKTKLKGEKIIKKKLKKININYAILRYFNVVGASSSKKIGPLKINDTLFKNISYNLQLKFPIIKIYGNNFNTKDGTCIRDFIHVSDLSNIHILIMKKIEKNKKSLILNCGYGNGFSVKQVVDRFIKISKKKTRIKILNKRPADIESSIADNCKLKKEIRWKPKFNNLNLIIKSCLNWERKINN